METYLSKQVADLMMMNSESGFKMLEITHQTWPISGDLSPPQCKKIDQLAVLKYNESQEYYTLMRRLFTLALAFAFLGATTLYGDAGVLCFMTQTVQAHCCCHQDKEDEAPNDSIDRACCELSVADVEKIPTTVLSFDTLPVTELFGSPFAVPVIEATFATQERLVVADARGPPPRLRPHVLHCTYLI